MKDRHFDHLDLWIILIAFVALGWACGLILPPFENLDEIEHFSVLRYVADTGRLPVHGAPDTAGYHLRQEASQPPLYYLLAGPLLRATGISTADTDGYLQPNAHLACGPSDTRYNKGTLRHDPNVERFPWRGALLALHLLRALSTLLQAGTVAGSYAVARLAFPQRRGVAPLAAALTAFNPQFLLLASGVNNDNLVTPLATAGLALALLAYRRGLSPLYAAGLGLLSGLAGLTKLSGLALIGVGGLVALEAAWRAYRRSADEGRAALWQGARLLLGRVALMGVVALPVVGWWLVRNVALYGDPTALAPMLVIVGQRHAPLVTPLLETHLMFRSYWGQLSCTFYRDWVYVVYGGLSAVGLIGLVAGLVRGKSDERLPAALLAAWFGAIYLSWYRWDLMTPAPGGRLLFPAVAAASALLAYGLARWHPRLGYAGAAVLALVGALVWGLEVRPLFAAPPRYAGPAQVSPSQPLAARFGDDIEVVGYDLRTGRDDLLELTVYWHPRARVERDYSVAVQLVSPAWEVLLNFNTWPGGGSYPTAAWQPGEVIVDRYRLPIPANPYASEEWQVYLIVYDPAGGARLPVTLDGVPAGEVLVLETIRIPATLAPSQ